MWWASSVAKWCGAMGCDLMSWWWDMAGRDVTLCGSKWLCDVVNWKMSWWSVLPSTQSTTQYYKVLQSTTPYSKILQVILCTIHYYKVLHGTTEYIKVLLRTIKYSILQSTILCRWGPDGQSKSQTHPTLTFAPGAAEQMSQLRNAAEAWTKQTKTVKHKTAMLSAMLTFASFGIGTPKKNPCRQTTSLAFSQVPCV